MIRLIYVVLWKDAVAYLEDIVAHLESYKQSG
jgi:hypothetical protein